MNTVLSEFLKSMQKRITDALMIRMPNTDSRLVNAMRYATLQGGKRLRPIIMYATAQTLNIPLEAVDTAACAIECIHAYSLIHDDLPAMDDDDFRRGMPSLHRAFDEATAILAGDALQTLAFEWLADPQCNPCTEKQRLGMIITLTHAIGYQGMAEGQMQDLLATHNTLSLEALTALHTAKTGALLEAAVQLTCIAGKNILPAAHMALTEYARALGLAFQIHDDILNVNSIAPEHQGRHGSDQQRGKSTYVTYLGLSEAESARKKALEKAVTACDYFSETENTLLIQIAQHCVSRNY